MPSAFGEWTAAFLEAELDDAFDGLIEVEKILAAAADGDDALRRVIERHFAARPE